MNILLFCNALKPIRMKLNQLTFYFFLIFFFFQSCAKEDNPLKYYDVKNTTWNVVFSLNGTNVPSKLIFTDGNLNVLGEDVNYMQYGNMVSWLYHDSVICDAQLKLDSSLIGEVSMTKGNRKLGSFTATMEK